MPLACVELRYQELKCFGAAALGSFPSEPWGGAEHCTAGGEAGTGTPRPGRSPPGTDGGLVPQQGYLEVPCSLGSLGLVLHWQRSFQNPRSGCFMLFWVFFIKLNSYARGNHRSLVFSLCEQPGSRRPLLEVVAWFRDKTNYLMQCGSPIFTANIIK